MVSHWGYGDMVLKEGLYGRPDEISSANQRKATRVEETFIPTAGGCSSHGLPHAAFNPRRCTLTY